MSRDVEKTPVEEATVTYEVSDGIAVITLDRPKQMNALSNQLVAELRDALERYGASDERCAVITGSGDRAFSVGADLRDPPRDPELWECMPGVGVELDKPVIAAVEGYCVGGAYVLVQFCDLAVASETADFFYPEAQLGFSGGLIAGCAARIPHKFAMEFMLTGAHFDGRRAYEVGMVNRVVPPGKHLEEATKLARVLADSAPLVVAMMKSFVRDTVTPRGPSELSALARKQLQSIQRSADGEEGRRAFAEKRAPRFTGS